MSDWMRHLSDEQLDEASSQAYAEYLAYRREIQRRREAARRHAAVAERGKKSEWIRQRNAELFRRVLDGREDVGVVAASLSMTSQNAKYLLSVERVGRQMAGHLTGDAE